MTQAQKHDEGLLLCVEQSAVAMHGVTGAMGNAPCYHLHSLLLLATATGVDTQVLVLACAVHPREESGKA